VDGAANVKHTSVSRPKKTPPSRGRIDKRKKHEQIKNQQSFKLSLLQNTSGSIPFDDSFPPKPANDPSRSSTSPARRSVSEPGPAHIALTHRLKALDDILRSRPAPPPPRRAMVGGSRGLFASSAFWEELRARVHGLTVETELARIAAVRARVPEVIQRVKLFRYRPAQAPPAAQPSGELPGVGGGGGEDEAAVGDARRAAEEVARLLTAVEEVEDAYPYTHACGHHKLDRPSGLRLDEPKGLARFHPEFTCGSLDDRSTFVSNLEVRRNARFDRWFDHLFDHGFDK
jgi:hypothetical protein